MKFSFNEKEASVSNKNKFLFEMEAPFSLNENFISNSYLKYAINLLLFLYFLNENIIIYL